MRITPRIGSTLVGALFLALVATQSMIGPASADANETTAGGSNVAHQSSITAGGNHTCALLTSGAVKCWGYNTYGQLGDDSMDDKHIPTAVTGLSSGVTAVSAGYLHTCALLTGGAVKCWGNSDQGQIGDNYTVKRLAPVSVEGLDSGVTAISSGAFHTCALLTGGAVKCWGYNSNGQLGNGTDSPSRTPINVSGLSSGVTAISAGGFHTCAITSGGGLKCWGMNDSGQLGDGTTTDKLTPTSVSGLASGVIMVSSAADHTCAVLAGGAAKCWGYNAHGQIGDTTSTSKSVPTAVTGLTSGVTAISADGNHTCAILTGGTAKCWGNNDFGQIGDTTTTSKSDPTAVTGLTSGVTAITIGAFHSCAILADGAAKCWGANDDGELGDETLTNRAIPTAVFGLNSGVGPTPTSSSLAPTTTVAKPSAPLIRINKSTTAKSIAVYAKLTVASTSKLSVKVAAASSKYCKVSGSSLKGIKTGTCKMTLTVTPKKGKAVSKSVSLKVTK